MASSFGVRIEGVRELTREIAKLNPELRKELGQRNKGIGQEIIDRAVPKPTPVGTGRGAMPRPSASANVLRIVAGGAHRARHAPEQPWGARFTPRDEERPFLVRSAEIHMPNVEAEYLDAIAAVAAKAGIRFKK